MRLLSQTAILGACAGAAAAQQPPPSSVVNSPHNLSALGPSVIRATTEEQVCIFCHVPHNATPVRALWSRALPTEAYAIYTSRALDAAPGQPTGESKMCLSCHDGTIALGAVISRPTPITMVGGITALPAGRTNIGTDLRDDHPISFRYDASLVAKDRKLRDPRALPSPFHLDSNLELQCTTCHDAHNNAFGDFLVSSNINSQLCTSCHQMGVTTVTGHASCDACHQPHTAPSGPYLLRGQTIAETCLACHDGTVVGAADIARDQRRPYTHDTGSPVDPPGQPWEHASCADCHEPHTMTPGPGRAPVVHGSFGLVGGMSASGSPITRASYEYEVCFQCHADGGGGGATRDPWISRQIVQGNTRLEFSPSAISYHPVEVPGRNPIVPSLRPGWNASSLMYCTDCHSSDTAPAAGGAAGGGGGGSGPAGLHGSSFAPLLAERYETADFTSESSHAYSLCYQCHERTSILSDESFPGHKLHIVDQRTPCAACHDAHGISSSQGKPMANTHLINFATAIVLPDPRTGRLEYRDLGASAGQCFLRCHGVDHSPLGYP
jgi:predicted CXXCH cytochrome family protein